MPDGAAETVLERKAQAQRRALGMGAVSVPRALGRSLSIAADALWALGLSCSALADDTLSSEKALSRLSDDQLFLILEKENAPRALLALDRSLVTGLIEVQTLGKVTRFPLDERPFTPTDAAMMAPLVDAALPRFGSMLSGQPDRMHLQGYAFGALVDDVPSVGLALEAENMQAFVFDVGLAQDTRQGQVVFLFPEPVKVQGAEGAEPHHGKYESVMKLVPARMQAVLTRIHVPLSKAQALKPGDVLEISPNAITAATLLVDGGHVVAKGKIGQMNGFRAVRIGGDAPLLLKPAVPQPDPPAQTPESSVTESMNVTFPPPAVATDGLDPTSSSGNMTLDDLAAGLPDPADLV